MCRDHSGPFLRVMAQLETVTNIPWTAHARLAAAFPLTRLEDFIVSPMQCNLKSDGVFNKYQYSSLYYLEKI